MKYRSKYNATSVALEGLKFDSKAEANRYLELKQLLKAGLIKNLELQPVIICQLNGVKICKYIGDFKYINEAGESTIEDVKGYKTPIYNLKKKIVKAIHNIDIYEHYAKLKRKPRKRKVPVE